MKTTLVTLFLVFYLFCFSQSRYEDSSYKKLVFSADSAFKEGNYVLCGKKYEMAFQLGKPNFFNSFRAAKCFALAKNAQKSIAYLNQSVDLNWQYSCKWLQKDEKLNALKSLEEWQKLIEKCETHSSSVNQALRDELLTLRDEYQKLTNATPESNHKSYKAHSLKLKEFKQRNTRRIKEIIGQHGWPGSSLVGEIGTHAAWLLVQHADMDPIFQEKCLGLLKKAYLSGEASGRNYAFLYDRVMVNKGERQLYGTQIYLNSITNYYEFCPIQNEVNLNKRRSEVGLQWSAEEYAKVLGFSYHTLTDEQQVEKLKDKASEYQLLSDEAHLALKEKNYESAIPKFIRVMELNGNFQNQDLITGSIALAHSKEDRSGTFFLWLKKAVVRGWKGMNTLRKSKHFRAYKLDKRWEMLAELEKTISEGQSNK